MSPREPTGQAETRTDEESPLLTPPTATNDIPGDQELAVVKLIAVLLSVWVCKAPYFH